MQSGKWEKRMNTLSLGQTTPSGAAHPPANGARSAPLRIPLLAMGAVALLAALTAALLRTGWSLPLVSGSFVGQHGGLMVGGFLGTLIGLERAIALQRRWTYLGPLASGLGGLALLAGLPDFASRGLMVLAGVGLVAVFALIYRLRPTIDSAVMGFGAMGWLVGNALWLAGLPMAHVVPWWFGFLILTVAGERLELSAVLRLKPATHKLFAGAAVVFIIGLAMSLFAFDLGLRVMGLGLAALGVWLLRYDVARRTIRATQLPRFIAACLLAGYAWLVIAGALFVAAGASYAQGLLYDAALHAIFLGFVISMIFGHAPIVLPAVLRFPVFYHPILFAPLAFLHMGLLVRVAGDLANAPMLWKWGSLFNVLAVLLFLGSAAFAIRRMKMQTK